MIYLKMMLKKGMIKNNTLPLWLLFIIPEFQQKLLYCKLLLEVVGKRERMA